MVHHSRYVYTNSFRGIKRVGNRAIREKPTWTLSHEIQGRRPRFMVNHMLNEMMRKPQNIRTRAMNMRRKYRDGVRAELESAKCLAKVMRRIQKLRNASPARITFSARAPYKWGVGRMTYLRTRNQRWRTSREESRRGRST